MGAKMSASKVVLWLGPVSTDNIARAVPPGWIVKTVNHGPSGGIHVDDFRAWALSLGADPLTHIAPDAEQFILMTFSAGHGAADVILSRVAATNDPRLSGVIAVDSYYTNTAHDPPKPGFFAFGELAARDMRPFWITTSTSPNQARPSASECIVPLAHALRLRPVRAPPDMPRPVAAFGRGGVKWLDYRDLFTHRDHARLLAPAALGAWPREPRPRGLEALLPLVPLVALAVRFLRRSR